MRNDKSGLGMNQTGAPYVEFNGTIQPFYNCSLICSSNTPRSLREMLNAGLLVAFSNPLACGAGMDSGVMHGQGPDVSEPDDEVLLALEQKLGKSRSSFMPAAIVLPDIDVIISEDRTACTVL
jgi:hypothetical protein